MHIERLDHVNIAARDIGATRDFYVDVIGLKVGDRPPFTFPGYWLYDDRVAVIHLTGSDGGSTERGSGAIDHIAFRAAGLTAMRARLEAAGTASSELLIPRTGELQIFLRDPDGIAIELTYAASEVAATPELARK